MTILVQLGPQAMVEVEEDVEGAAKAMEETAKEATQTEAEEVAR